MVAQKKAPQPPSCPPPTHLLTLPVPKKQALTTVVAARPKKRPLATAKVNVEVDTEAETKAKKATKAAEVRGLPKVSLAKGAPSFSCNFRAPRALWAS